jgi:hypothetical protein
MSDDAGIIEDVDAVAVAEDEVDATLDDSTARVRRNADMLLGIKRRVERRRCRGARYLADLRQRHQ